ncbi:hypothetical protein NDU88_008042 [Pleurodeles waltl]|uniref:Uncharacterized protein n=1 Tax=Pleurodeles waltl TaxID=8319 RepID=A0AAV7PND5_PLEWA|nr:hypothetical protein NDU88_008042 [Pleurodeles waltl]
MSVRIIDSGCIRRGTVRGVCWLGFFGGNPIIQMLCGPSGELILGQLRVNLHPWEHMRALYTAPCGVGVTRIGEYFDGLRLPLLTETQSEEMEGEVSLDDLVEALGGMASRKAPGPDY